MEPLGISFCYFVQRPLNFLPIYYRTSNSSLLPAQSLQILYRRNGGPWTGINVLSSNGPASYTLAATLNVSDYDVIEYYFTQSQCTPYGYGNGGSFTGGALGSLTVVGGGNAIYFNICSSYNSVSSQFCAIC